MTTHKYTLPIQQQQQQQQQQQVPVLNENPNQYRMYQQNLHSNPAVSYASPSRDDLNYFYHTANPSVYDFIQLTPIDYPMPVNYVKYNGFQSFMPLISRSRRQNLKQPENLNSEGDDSEGDDSYDSSKFFKVRLSMGPITIKNNKPANEEEDISCTLNLMNSHDADLPDFSSTIHKKIKLYFIPSFVDSSIPSPPPPSHSTGTIEQQSPLQIDSNNKKEIMFLIDSNSTTTPETKLSRSEIALETIRNKGLTQMDRLLASSSVTTQMFNKCYWLVIIMWIITYFCNFQF